MKYIFLTAILFIVACAGHAKVDLTQIHNDTLVSCHSNVEKLDIDYLKSNRSDYQSTIFSSVTISNIIDVYGKSWTINSQEWTQFKCTEKALP